MRDRKKIIYNLDKDNLNVLYEDLRVDALCASINYCSKSQGLGLFIQKGMAAWVEAWTNCVSSPHLPVKEHLENSQQNLPGGGLHTEVAILLTNMALNIWQGAKANG